MMLKQFKNLTINVQIRLLTSFFSRFFGNMVYPFMAIYLTTYYSESTSGLFLLIITSLALVIGLFSGYLADRFGKKTIMVLAQLFQTLALIVMACLNSPLLIIPSVTFMMMLLQNIAVAVLNPAAEAMIIDDSTPKDRTFIYSIDYWAMNLSIMFGSMIGGVFFKKYRFWLFMLLALSSSVVLYIMVRYLKKDSIKKSVKDELSNIFLMYKEVLKNYYFICYCLAQLLIFSLDAQVINYVSVRLTKDFFAKIWGLELNGIQMSGLIRTENTIVVVLFTLIVPNLTKKFGEKKLLCFGLVIYIISFFEIISSNDFLVLVISVFTASIGEVYIIPLSKIILAELSTKKLRGTYMAINGFIYRGTALAGSVGLIMAPYLTAVEVAFFWTGLATVGAISYLVLLKYLKLT